MAQTGYSPKTGFLPQTGYYITESGKRIEITPDSYIYLTKKYLIEAVIPLGCNRVDCNFNKKLRTLNVPNDVEIIQFVDTNIQSFNFPSSAVSIQCDLSNGIEQQYKKNLDLQIYQKDYFKI